MDRPYFAESHRGGYLECNAIQNPPPPATPLYAIQYASSPSNAICMTPTPTLILYATASDFYLLNIIAAETVIGRWRKGKASPAGPEPELRLDFAAYLWVSTSPVSEQCLKNLEMFKTADMMELYHRILRQCHPFTGSVLSSSDAHELREITPGPTAPQSGIPLGTPIGDYQSGNEPLAEPPTRRGVERPRRVDHSAALSGI